MSHVDGVDDGVGYGVQGSSQQRMLVCMARATTALVWLA